MTSLLPYLLGSKLDLFFEAGNETRTRDPEHGKLMLYQLSYSRTMSSSISVTNPENSVKREGIFFSESGYMNPSAYLCGVFAVSVVLNI